MLAVAFALIAIGWLLIYTGWGNHSITAEIASAFGG